METNELRHAPKWVAQFFGILYFLLIAATFVLLLFAPLENSTVFWKIVWFIAIASLALLCVTFPAVIFEFASKVSRTAKRIHFTILLFAFMASAVVLLADAVIRLELQSFTGGILSAGFAFLIWKMLVSRSLDK